MAVPGRSSAGELAAAVAPSAGLSSPDPRPGPSFPRLPAGFKADPDPALAFSFANGVFPAPGVNARRRSSASRFASLAFSVAYRLL